MKRVLICMLLLMLTAGAVAEQEMETIELMERASIHLDEGLLPVAAQRVEDHSGVVWKSSDPWIAAVESGDVLHAKMPGECTFTAWDDGEELASFRLLVTPANMQPTIQMSLHAFTRVKLTSQMALAASIVDQYPDIMWESSNPAVAIVDHSNALYGKKPGQCEIYGMCEDRPVTVIDVTVLPNPDVEEKFIAFTFDDGPSKPTWTILETLDEYGIRATFFMVGEMVELRPGTALAVYEAGHEIGNHTYTHPNLNKLSAERAMEEIKSTDALLRELTGAYPTLIRAPGGNITAENAETYGADRYFIHWTLDTNDWKSRDTDEVYSVVHKRHFDCAVVLMHDLYATTAKAFDKLVPELILEGYTFVTVSEMMDITGLPEGRIYGK